MKQLISFQTRLLENDHLGQKKTHNGKRIIHRISYLICCPKRSMRKDYFRKHLQNQHGIDGDENEKEHPELFTRAKSVKTIQCSQIINGHTPKMGLSERYKWKLFRNPNSVFSVDELCELFSKWLVSFSGKSYVPRKCITDKNQKLLGFVPVSNEDLKLVIRHSSDLNQFLKWVTKSEYGILGRKFTMRHMLDCLMNWACDEDGANKFMLSLMRKLSESSLARKFLLVQKFSRYLKCRINSTLKLEYLDVLEETVLTIKNNFSRESLRIMKIKLATGETILSPEEIKKFLNSPHHAKQMDIIESDDWEDYFVQKAQSNLKQAKSDMRIIGSNLAILVLLACGQRTGEITALKISDVKKSGILYKEQQLHNNTDRLI